MHSKKDREDRDAAKKATRDREIANMLREQMLVVERQKTEAGYE